MQTAGPDSALITGETVRLRFSVKGYDASESWDIYWTGRQVWPAPVLLCYGVAMHADTVEYVHQAS